VRTEKTWVQVGNERQGVFLVGGDLSRPVLLFVHGGPGMPEYWLTQRRPIAFEELFTVAWWEQRGAGLSYRPHIPADEMTGERFVSDAIAVTNHLRERFGAEKVYLMAHSWGSYIGLQAASRGSRAVQRLHRYRSDDASDPVGGARL